MAISIHSQSHVFELVDAADWSWTLDEQRVGDSAPGACDRLAQVASNRGRRTTYGPAVRPGVLELSGQGAPLAVEPGA